MVKKNALTNGLKADTSAIEELKEKVSTFTAKVTRNPSLTDYIIVLSLAFGAVGIAHFGATNISSFLKNNFSTVANTSSALSSFSSNFFWMITIATAIGILLSFTKAKNYEGAGASKIGSIFIYILVATIGMKMDIFKSFRRP